MQQLAMARTKQRAWETPRELQTDEPPPSPTKMIVLKVSNTEDKKVPGSSQFGFTLGKSVGLTWLPSMMKQLLGK